MPYLWLLLLWLVCITIFFADTWLTLLFIGHRTYPAVRQEWAAVLLAVPLVTLLLSPLWLWAASALVLSGTLHLCAHLLGYRRMMRGLAEAPAEVTQQVRALAAGWGLAGSVPVWLEPTDRLEPAVTGLLQPVLILTPSALALPPADFRAVVAHELAHIRHRDPLRLWAVGVARSLLGWHPLARSTADLLAVEVEMAADRQAVAWTGDRETYALAIGRWGLGRADQSRRPTGSAVLGASSHLLARITSLIDEESPAPHLTLPAWLPRGRVKSASPARLRWIHLALGSGYTLLFLLAARQF